jgi:hypothetical protein
MAAEIVTGTESEEIGVAIDIEEMRTEIGS